MFLYQGLVKNSFKSSFVMPWSGSRPRRLASASNSCTANSPVSPMPERVGIRRAVKQRHHWIFPNVACEHGLTDAAAKIFFWQPAGDGQLLEPLLHRLPPLSFLASGLVEETESLEPDLRP